MHGLVPRVHRVALLGVGRRLEDQVGLAVHLLEVPDVVARPLDRLRHVLHVALGRAGRHPLDDGVDLGVAQRAVVLEVLDAQALVEVPGRHLPGLHAVADRAGPRPALLVGDERHRRDRIGPVARLALRLEDRRDVLGEGRRRWQPSARRPERPPQAVKASAPATGPDTDRDSSARSSRNGDDSQQGLRSTRGGDSTQISASGASHAQGGPERRAISWTHQPQLGRSGRLPALDSGQLAQNQAVQVLGLGHPEQHRVVAALGPPLDDRHLAAGVDGRVVHDLGEGQRRRRGGSTSRSPGRRRARAAAAPAG